MRALKDDGKKKINITGLTCELRWCNAESTRMPMRVLLSHLENGPPNLLLVATDAARPTLECRLKESAHCCPVRKKKVQLFGSEIHAIKLPVINWSSFLYFCETGFHVIFYSGYVFISLCTNCLKFGKLLFGDCCHVMAWCGSAMAWRGVVGPTPTDLHVPISLLKAMAWCGSARVHACKDSRPGWATTATRPHGELTRWLVISYAAADDVAYRGGTRVPVSTLPGEMRLDVVSSSSWAFEACDCCVLPGARGCLPPGGHLRVATAPLPCARGVQAQRRRQRPFRQSVYWL